MKSVIRSVHALGQAYPVSLVEFAPARFASELTEGALLDEETALLVLCVIVRIVAVDVSGAAVELRVVVVEVEEEDDFATDDDAVEDDARTVDDWVMSLIRNRAEFRTHGGR